MKTSRRSFIKTTAGSAASLAFLGGGSFSIAKNKGQKTRFAQIGCGGRGKAHYSMWKNNDFVAAVDTNRKTVDMFNKERFPNLGRYTDYREMYAKHMDDIDAVIVATPDHSHYPAAMLALMEGKAVFCEKPLAWSMNECFDLARVAKAKQLPTQMGNQGNAGKGWRDLYAMVHQGLIGEVKEVSHWTNRPVWPQGNPCTDKVDPIPEHLDWDSWIGPAPMREYNSAIQPFKWRGYYAYGCGALGDMACHTMNATFQVMKPGYDCVIEPTKIVDGDSKCQFPSKEIIKWSFPATSEKPAYDVYWYDGNLKPEKPKAMGSHQLPDRGVAFIGTDGVLISQGDYNDKNTLYKDGKKIENVKFDPMIEPSKGGFHGEFLNAVKGDAAWDSPMSNFMYAGKMTAIINMGPIAQKLGRKIEFSSKSMKFNDADANALMGRKPRAGWETPYKV